MSNKIQFKYLKARIVALSLILWLVCFSVGWEQDLSDINSDSFNDPIGYSDREIEEIRNQQKILVLEGLLGLLDEYEKECQKDSIKVLVEYYDVEKYKKTKIINVHKSKEPTFRGFIIFLKGKGRKTN